MLILPGKLSLSACLVLSMSLAIASGPSLILGPPPLPAIGGITACKVLKSFSGGSTFVLVLNSLASNAT